jgi:hypothetical protein
MAVETVAGAEAVAAERARILSTLLGRIDAVTEAGVAAIRNQIPAYSAQRDERFLADLASQVRLNYSTTLSGMLEERVVTPDDIAFIRGAAMRRAEIGIALEDYLAAYRVGQLVLWDAMVACASDSDAGREAASSTSPARSPGRPSSSSGSLQSRKQTATDETCWRYCSRASSPRGDRCTSRHGTTGSAPRRGRSWSQPLRAGRARATR